jgi:hypothetical protein
MAIEGHKRGREGDLHQKIKAEIDKGLEEIRVEMDRMTLKMQQESQVRWRYEWPMKKRTKCPIQNFMARRQQQHLRR